MALSARIKTRVIVVSGRLWLPASCWRGAAPCTISNSLSPSQKECHRDVTGDTEMGQGECSSNEIEDLVTRIHTVHRATAPPHRATGRGQPISDRPRTARDEVGFVECQEQRCDGDVLVSHHRASG